MGRHSVRAIITFQEMINYHSFTQVEQDNRNYLVPIFDWSNFLQRAFPDYTEKNLPLVLIEFDKKSKRFYLQDPTGILKKIDHQSKVYFCAHGSQLLPRHVSKNQNIGDLKAECENGLTISVEELSKLLTNHLPNNNLRTQFTGSRLQIELFVCEAQGFATSLQKELHSKGNIFTDIKFFNKDTTMRGGKLRAAGNIPAAKQLVLLNENNNQIYCNNNPKDTINVECVNLLNIWLNYITNVIRNYSSESGITIKLDQCDTLNDLQEIIANLPPTNKKQDLTKSEQAIKDLYHKLCSLDDGFKTILFKDTENATVYFRLRVVKDFAKIPKLEEMIATNQIVIHTNFSSFKASERNLSRTKILANLDLQAFTKDSKPFSYYEFSYKEVLPRSYIAKKIAENKFTITKNSIFESFWLDSTFPTQKVEEFEKVEVHVCAAETENKDQAGEILAKVNFFSRSAHVVRQTSVNYYIPMGAHEDPCDTSDTLSDIITKSKKSSAQRRFNIAQSNILNY